ncbi:MAG TPA: 50S ribosomal protein L6 [Planctomycetota bacterium]|jgi:large subunit ribosomal protein L6|nr:50S ribosomal protein L6 [Planctomycetota bacterium]
MSRLGKKPIDLPEKVKVSVAGQTVTAEGPQGRHALTLPAEVSAKVEEGKRVVVSCKGQTQQQKALWGTWRSHVANLIEGVSKGYEKSLEINGVGYNAKVQGDKLVMTLGFSHPVEMTIPKGLAVACPSPTAIVVKGVDKHLVGQFAAEVRAKRPAEPYNLKGIKYKDEAVRRKAGKTFVTGAT